MIVFTFALHGTHPTVSVALASSHTSLLPTSISYQTSQHHFVGLERRSGEREREFYLERGHVVLACVRGKTESDDGRHDYLLSAVAAFKGKDRKQRVGHRS